MSSRGVITLLVRELSSDHLFSQSVPRQVVRDAWTRVQSLLIPSTNRLDFTSYTAPIPQGTLQVQFASSPDGTGVVAGYAALVREEQVTFLTPVIGADKTIYGRYGDGIHWTNWFPLFVERVSTPVTPVTPPPTATEVHIVFGLADTSDAPTGSPQTLILRNTFTGTFTTPHATTLAPRWYFEIPRGYELVSIKRQGLSGSMPTPDANWVQIGSTNRYINRAAVPGFDATCVITIQATTGGGTPPPVNMLMFAFGLADTSKNPVGVAETFQLPEGTLTGTFTPPLNTSRAPLVYFDIPQGYEITYIDWVEDDHLGVTDPDWVREGTTNRYIHSALNYPGGVASPIRFRIVRSTS